MQKGFFTIKETESVSRPDGKVYSCVSCGAYKNVNTPRMKPWGNFKKHIMIVGNAPTKIDDKVGTPWQDKSGRILNKTLKELGINLFEDCISICSCFCCTMDKSGEERNPTNYEVDCCRKTLLKYVKEYQPKMILLLGNQAIYSLIGHRWKKDLGGVDKWRGFRIPDVDFKAWLCPTFNPEDIEENDLKEIIWRADLRNAIDIYNKPVTKYHEPKIIVLKDDLSPLNDIKDHSVVAFDYETTGLKPHSQGHRIVCASVAISSHIVYSFMMPDTKVGRKPFLNLLTNDKIRKMAHNMKFEDTWSAVRLRLSVSGWEWDSMLAAHILDNRPGITSLKFQSYINFGIVDYSSDITPYLQTAGKNANELNTIEELIKTKSGEEMLLKYCALDSIYEYRLAMLQREQIMNNPPF